MITEATFETPWGVGTVVVEDGRLLEVRLPRATGAPPAGRDVPAGHDLPDDTVPALPVDDAPADGSLAGPASSWARELGEYFRGGRRSWSDEELQLDSLGFTAFRTAVYRALLQVPAGSTITYGELARRAGRPGAARAVGSAMAENPIAIVVPCHRVVRTDGSLGHYGFGDAWKPYLLQMEGASI
ncbi:MAG: methylated-DNA--[protein]-cysteine S-methyltransferase [Thermoleophilia bacterium]